MQSLRQHLFWRISWLLIGSCMCALEAFEGVRTHSVGPMLGGAGFAAWGLMWFFLPVRPNISLKENLRQTVSAARELPWSIKLLIPVGFILILASLIWQFA